MKNAAYGPTWFEDDEFLELVVSFPGPPPSQWTLERKIYEHEYSGARKNGGLKPDNEGEKSSDHGEEEGKGRGRGSYEACAIYTCTRINEAKPTTTGDEAETEVKGEDEAKAEGKAKRAPEPELDPPPENAVMKIRLQIPSPTTQTDPLTVRASQATTSLTTLATNEIEALTSLTAAKCTSTPALLGWKQDMQDDDAGVPGGYVVYILMKQLPGVRVDNFMRDLAREGRDALRECFREAWLECKACGAINLDTGIRNLLWDRERMKCYILDFELYRKPTDEDVWDDSLYLAWNLAWANEGDPNDMSTWEL